MNAVARRVMWSLSGESTMNPRSQLQWNHQVQQSRGIRVKVLNGNLERALSFLQRKMQWSGIERIIKKQQTRHVKNSEKRVLARKNLQRKLQSQDLARKLQTILSKKVRGL